LIPAATATAQLRGVAWSRKYKEAAQEYPLLLAHFAWDYFAFSYLLWTNPLGMSVPGVLGYIRIPAMNFLSNLCC